VKFARFLQEEDSFCKSLAAEESTCEDTPASPLPSCFASRSKSHWGCAPELSFDLLIPNRSNEIKTDLIGAVETDGFWAALLENKAAAYVFTAGLDHDVPEIHCCITDVMELSDCGDDLNGPVVVKAVDQHSNVGTFDFPEGLSEGTDSPEMLSGSSYSLADIESALGALYC